MIKPKKRNSVYIIKVKDINYTIEKVKKPRVQKKRVNKGEIL